MIDSGALSRVAMRIEQLQRKNTASWNNADALALRRALPGPGASPDPPERRRGRPQARHPREHLVDP